MAKYNKKYNDTTVRIGEVRFCFCHVFSTKVSDDGKESYGVQIRIPKENTEAVKLVNDAVEAAIKAGTEKKWGGKRPVPAKLRLPLRDGDAEYPDDESYKGMWFLNANAQPTQKPGIKVLENGAVNDALDEGDFYSGCWGAASVGFFAYDNGGNKGIGVGLNNVIKTKDGEKFGGGRSADEDFGDLNDEF